MALRDLPLFSNWIRRYDKARRFVRKSSLLANLLSVSGATLVSQLISLATLGYSARVLGPEKYGLAAFGVSVLAYATILLSPGLLTWGTRAIARDRTSSGKVLAVINLTQFVLACLSYAALSLYAFTFLSGLERLVVLLYGLGLFTTALSVDWVFNGLELMRIPSVLGIVQSILYTIGILSLIRSPDDLYRLPLLITAVPLLITGILYVILFGRLKVRLNLPSLQDFKTAIFASVPLGLLAVLVKVTNYANNLIVKGYLGSEALGTFFSAFRLVEMVSLIPNIISSVFMPRLSRLVSTDESAARQEALLYARFQMTIAFLFGTMLFGEAPAIVNIIYGTRFIEAGNLLRVMSIGVVFTFAIISYTNCLIAFGKDWVMVLALMSALVATVGGGLILVPMLGSIGAAVAVALLNLSGWLVSLPFYRQVVGSLQLGAWKRPLLGGIFLVAAAFALQRIGVSVWLRIPIEVLAYLPFALKIFRDILTALKRDGK
jgi:O-antigen/teichoic acid export membrane protein